MPFVLSIGHWVTTGLLAMSRLMTRSRGDGLNDSMLMRTSTWLLWWSEEKMSMVACRQKEREGTAGEKKR